MRDWYSIICYNDFSSRVEVKNDNFYNFVGLGFFSGDGINGLNINDLDI